MAAYPQPKVRAAESEWRTARRLYAIYSSVLARFDLGVPPCPEIESLIDRQDDEVRDRVEEWITLMDDHCPVMLLRQVLQRDQIGSQENLLALIRRHLDRENKTVVDRTKLDFLLVQFVVNSMPEGLSPSELTLAEVGRALEPVLGAYTLAIPAWLQPLSQLSEEVLKCHRMQDLVDLKILQRGREIKADAGDQFVQPIALVLFTHYNILLRRTFIYSLRADLAVLQRNVNRLEKLGAKCIDARSAGLSEHESLSSVRRICLEWRNLLSTEYSSGQVFRAINELRSCTENALLASEERLKLERQKRRERRHAAAAAAAGGIGVRLRIDLSDDFQTTFEDRDLEPEMTVEAAYPELTVDYETISANAERYRIPAVIGRIRSQLARTEAAKALSVYFGSSAIRLSSWEAKAFLVDEDESVGAVKASVAARLILRKAFDEFREGVTGALSTALTIAHCEAARTQELVAQVRERCDIDRIVFLSATAQRLLELIREAEFALG